MSNYNHLTAEQRVRISILFRHHNSIRSIAKEVGCNASTISREIKRNSYEGKYECKLAQVIANSKLTPKDEYSFSKSKYDDFNIMFAELFNKNSSGVYTTIQTIKEKYPDIHCPSIAQVYRWINTNEWIIKRDELLIKEYISGGKPKEKVEINYDGRYVFPINIRPSIINKRARYGDWELDLINGTKGDYYQHLMVLVERKTRRVYIKKLVNKNPWNLVKNLLELIRTNNLQIYSISVDNGIEFKRIGRVAKELKDCKIFICNPYASWERGTVEVMNRMIRRYFPKGTDFRKISNDEIQHVEDLINNMKRKIFNGRSSKDMEKIELSNKL